MFLFGLFFCCLLTFARSNLNCSKLNIRTSTLPFSGIALSYCSSTMLQCCTDDYLQGKANDTREKLLSSLREELISGNFIIVGSIVKDMQKYIEDTFAPEFASRLQVMNKLSSSNRETFIDSFMSSVSSNLEINTSSSFNLSTFFGQHLHNLNLGFINDYLGQYAIGGLNNVRITCINNLLDNDEAVVNMTAIQEIVKNFEKLRKIYSFLISMKNWYENDLVPKILQEGFPSTCINSFMRLQCAACIQNIPSLCNSDCQYLTQGCFVPFRQGLRAQMDILWNITRQLLDEQSINYIISEAFNNGRRTLKFNFDSDFINFALIVHTKCQTLLSKSLRKRRSTTNGATVYSTVPSSIISNTSTLNGSFEYNSDGPLFCQSNPQHNCWDGTQEKMQDDLDIDYDDSIENQDMNPVASFNRTELLKIAQRLGTPVSDYLENHQLLIGIDGIEIPAGETFGLFIEPRPAPSSTSSVASSTDSFMSSSIKPSPTNALDTQPSSGCFLTASFTAILLSALILVLQIIIF